MLILSQETIEGWEENDKENRVARLRVQIVVDHIELGSGNKE
jgi:hypothetical protein